MLTQKELDGYRQWLEELDEEAREPGGDLTKCDPEVWDTFNPKKSPGNDIYESFSNNELLDKMIETMQHQGHSPQYKNIHYIYLKYIEKRFSGLNNAKAMARKRLKLQQIRSSAPPGWYEHVSVEPLIIKCRERDRELSQEDIAFLNQLCDQARETHKPPYLSGNVRERLSKIYQWNQALRLMGFPSADAGTVGEYNRYWYVKNYGR